MFKQLNMSHFFQIVLLSLIYSINTNAADLVIDDSRQLVYHPATSSTSVIVVQDVSIASQPIQVGAVEIQAPLTDLALDTTRQLLFVAMGTDGMTVIDVSDSANLQHVGRRITKAWDIALKDTTLFIAQRNDDIDVVDTTDLSNLPVVNTFQYFSFRTHGSAPTVTVAEVFNDTLWLASTRDVVNAWRINSPTNLELLYIGPDIFNSGVPSSIVFGNGLAAYSDGTLYVNDANDGDRLGFSSEISGGLYDIVGNYIYRVGPNGSFDLVDLTDPSAPVFALNVPRESMATSIRDAQESNGKLYVIENLSTDGLFQIYDVTQPLVPHLLASVSGAAGTNPDPAPEENKLPVANAGPDQQVGSRANVTLNGSASFDPDGSIVSYQWKQGQGPTVTLSNTDSAIVTFRAPRVKRKRSVLVTFDLTVTDDKGATDTDTVYVLVGN